jgi:hypothetical protein
MALLVMLHFLDRSVVIVRIWVRAWMETSVIWKGEEEGGEGSTRDINFVKSFTKKLNLSKFRNFGI